MKVYIAGPITGNPNYMEQFAKAEQELREQGHTPMNPSVLPQGFEQDEYMKICYSMIDVCDAVYFLDNWWKSKGANLEQVYAIQKGKTLMDTRGTAKAAEGSEFHEIANEIVNMLDRKHADYGEGNLLKFGEKGILIRVSDKVERLVNLLKNSTNPNNESVEDTWEDIAGYAIQAIRIRRMQ